MDLFKKLTALQNDLKAPKGQYNKFGKYPYRNCEDILEAVKPLLVKHELGLVIGDKIENIGNRFYVVACARISDSENNYEVFGYARECDSKKGMDDAQLTGSCSSYARKYALNGLFLIDDTKDADSMENKPTTAASKKAGFTEEMFKKNVKSFTAEIATGTKTAEQIIKEIEKTYTVGDGAKAAIRGIK
jgi:hypothetical protein